MMNVSSGANTKDRKAPFVSSGMPVTLRAKRPDREAKLFLRSLSPFVGRPLNRHNVGAARWAWSLLAATLGRRVPVASIVEQEIDGPSGPIELRIYTPKGHAGLRPCFLWCHGGGFVVGDFDSNDSICRTLARESGSVVVAVRYRLAPEHDLYAGREDVFAALTWLAEKGTAIGIDPTRLAIGGDSAGGNISAAVTQETVRRRGPRIQFQVLVYPVTELFAEYPSTLENMSGYFLTTKFIRSLEPLVAQGKDLTDPWLSPALSADLKGLPPALIVTAGFDPIRDDGLRYATQLRSSGVAVELLHYPGQFHGFLNFDSINGAARDALTRIGASLAKALCDESAVDTSMEISDRASGSSFVSTELPADLLTASLLIGRSSRQLTGAVVRWLSPDIAKVAELCLRPWWVPVALVRRVVTAYLNTPSAKLTYSKETVVEARK